ncbi:MAG: hypothetical protein ACPF8V_10005, partial [Luteibaculum sp.]
MRGTRTREKIWFHGWPGASPVQDTLFDVAKFGLPSANAVTIDFMDGDRSLNMWVNALPQKAAAFELPLYGQFPKAGDYTIAFK